MSELLPCPFCGGEATMHHQGGGLGKQYWYVACHRMTCLMDLETPLMDTEAEAIEAWNTRATNQPNSLPDVSENHQEDENDTLKVNIHNLDELEEAYADALTYFYGKKYVPERTCRNVSNVDGNFVCSECEAWIEAHILWNDQYPGGESSYLKDCKLNYCPNCGAEVV